MTEDFSVPQRQSGIGVVVMFFDTLKDYMRAMWPLLVLWLINSDSEKKLFFGLAILGGLAVTAGASYLRYRNFTFYIDGANDEFIITLGVFSKTRTAIRLDRIQQVNINQSLIQRLVGVYELDVDTAGSNEKEARIKAVSHRLALALKARLLEESEKLSDAVSDEIVCETPQPFIRISFLSLVKTGITSNYVRTIGILLAFCVTVWENLFRPYDNSEDENSFRNYIDPEIIMQSVTFLVVLFCILVLVINLVRVVFKYYGFTINRQNGSLLLSFGLLHTKSTIIRPQRVQIATVTRNFLQKKLDILQMKIFQAGGGDLEKSSIDIPGCNISERDAILKLLYNEIPAEGIMLRPNYRKLVFSVFLSIMLPLCVFFLFVMYNPLLMKFIYAVPPYVLFTGLLLWFGFRNNRLFASDEYIILQSGAWDIGKKIIQPQKIQAITTSQLFWHRRPDIGSLTIHTAGGNITFSLGNFTNIREYVNRWLYSVEVSDKNWM